MTVDMFLKLTASFLNTLLFIPTQACSVFAAMCPFEVLALEGGLGCIGVRVFVFFWLSGCFCCLGFSGVFVFCCLGGGVFLFFAVWAGARGPRPNSKKKTPPPKQQKK